MLEAWNPKHSSVRCRNTKFTFDPVTKRPGAVSGPQMQRTRRDAARREDAPVFCARGSVAPPTHLDEAGRAGAPRSNKGDREQALHRQWGTPWHAPVYVFQR